MANRSYLYAIDFDRTSGSRKEGEKIFGLSECEYATPLSYLILVSQNSVVSKSINWDNEQPIAIQGSFSEGFVKLLEFLERLQVEEIFDKVELEKQIEKTKRFLEEHKLEKIILENAEIYDMEEEKMEVQNQKLFDKILNIDKWIEKYIAHFKKMNEEIAKEKDENNIKEIKHDMWDTLGINNWSDVLNYHFEN